MMVLHRDWKKIEHAHFVDLEKFLRDDDLLVLNNSRVLPARHFSDDRKFEFLFLDKIAPSRWKALVKPSRKFGKGAATFVQGVGAEAGELFADGLREIRRQAAREAERKALVDVLDRVQWNRAAASRILKVSYKTLLNKIVDCQLTPPRRQAANLRGGGPGR